VTVRYSKRGVDTVGNRIRDKKEARLSRHRRVRRKVRGSVERPRLVVFRSLNHIYAQVIDDDAGSTLVSASSLKLALPPVEEAAGGEKKKKKKPEGIKIRRSREVGRAIALAAVAKGIKRVIFDRGGFLYHGRVAALAEAARENGLEF
jgi:large subunit ribosomal protein L18